MQPLEERAHDDAPPPIARSTASISARDGRSRKALLANWSRLPGVYVPSLFKVRYHDGGEPLEGPGGAALDVQPSVRAGARAGRTGTTATRWADRAVGRGTGDVRVDPDQRRRALGGTGGGIVVTREAFERVSGFSEIPLMEDIEISKGLRRLSAPACLGTRLVTSSRRWEQDGITRTVLLMWRLRLAYYLGASPETLAERYRGG
mgnify:CR=1 FL=1